MRFVCALGVVFLLACSGVGQDEPSTACCSVADVIEMTARGVDTPVIIDAIRTSGTDLELAAEDIARMSEGGVDREVIDVLNGGPCVCEEAVVPEEPVPIPKGTEPAATGLRVAVKYNGGKSFELVNLSNRDYTGVTVLVNNEYQYRLKKLPANKSDFIRLSSFTSRKTGKDAKKVKMKSIAISSNQGNYSRTF